MLSGGGPQRRIGEGLSWLQACARQAGSCCDCCRGMAGLSRRLWLLRDVVAVWPRIIGLVCVCAPCVQVFCAEGRAWAAGVRACLPSPLSGGPPAPCGFCWSRWRRVAAAAHVFVFHVRPPPAIVSRQYIWSGPFLSATSCHATWLSGSEYQYSAWPEAITSLTSISPISLPRLPAVLHVRVL